MKETLTFGAVLKFLFHAYVIIFAFVLFLFYILFPDADSLCSDSSFCPIGGYVYRDFVCGKSVLVTEEYCRYFGGKLEDGLCDATYSLHHRKRCEAAGGKFVKTRWFTYVLVIVILGGLLWGGYFKVKQNVVTLRRYLVVVALSLMKILYSGVIVWVLFFHVVLLLV